MQAFNFTSPYTAEQTDIDNKRKYAEALQAQAIKPVSSGQMIGNHFVPPSKLEGLGKVLSAFLGAKGNRDADAASKDLQTRMNTDFTETGKKYAEALRGTPETQAPFQADNPFNEDLGSLTQVNPAVPGSRQAALDVAMQSKHPLWQQTGMTELLKGPAAEKWDQTPRYDQNGNAFILSDQGNRRVLDGVKSRDELVSEDLGGTKGFRSKYSPEIVGSASKTSTPDALMTDSRVKLEGDKNRGVTLRGQNMVDSRSRENTAASTSGGSKPPSGYRVTANGNLEAIPGGPADIKALALSQRQADGATDVDIAISTLRGSYDSLDKGGGITSTKKGGVDNAQAYLASSPVGQAAGKLLGTKNQSERNTIAMARPGLLAAIMKATGMSAKQLDSNAELKLWLSTATDPTLDVESNRKALSDIERKYLKGGSAKPIDKPKGGATFLGFE